MEIPSAFPMTLLECILHDVLPLVGKGNAKFLLTLNGTIDEGRLRKAVRLSLDVEPILGCRFVDRVFRPAWQRRQDLNEVSLCEVVGCTDNRPHVARFIETPIDTAREPLVRVLVVRATQDTGCPADTVCIKMAHEVVDGTSAKEYLHLLFRIYRRLKDDPGYRPQPNPTGVRSSGEVFRHVGLRERLAGLRRRRYARSRSRPRTVAASPLRR